MTKLLHSFLIFTFSTLCLKSYAFEDTDIKVSGDFRMRFESLQNPTAVYNASDSESHLNHRFKLNTKFRRAENLSAGLTLIHAAEWGSHSGQAVSSLSSTGTNDSSDATKDGIGDKQNMPLVQQAWGGWKSSDQLSFLMGRLSLELGDGSVFSELDYQQTPYSHDGVIANWDLDFVRTQIIGIKTNEYGQGFITHDAEKNIYIVGLDMKSIPEWLKLAHFHFIQVNKDATGTGSSTSPTGILGGKLSEQRAGLNVSGDKWGLTYQFSGEYVFGLAKTINSTQESNLSISEFMVQTRLGYAFNSAWSFKTNIGIHLDSGTKDLSSDKFATYESLYYDYHRYGGAMDVVRWGNLTSTDINMSFAPWDDIEFNISYFYFSRSVNNDTSATSGATAATTQFGSNYKNLTASTDKSELGHELDLKIIKSFDSGFKILTRASGFLPGAAIRDATTPKQDRVIQEYMLQAQMAF